MSTIRDIVTNWSHLRTIIDDKHLPIQYEYNPDGYNIFAVDNGITYSTVIYNNAVPDPEIYSQVQNDADKTDFLANYAPTANRIMQAFAARDGYTTNVYPILQGGTDNSGIVRIFRADSNRNAIIAGFGIAGTPAGGVLTVQGDPSGTPIPISGSVTASNPSVGTNNAAAPASSTQIGGSDGTNIQASRVYDVDSGAGSEYVIGISLRKAVNGGSVEYGTSTNPIRIDPTGTTAQPITDNGGSLTVDGTVAVSSVSGNVTVAQPTASNLNAQVQGTAAVSAPPVGNPVVIGGWDGTNVVRLKLNADGTVATSTVEAATFTASRTNIAVANNKSMVSIFNTDATLLTKIHEIYVINVQTSAVTGVTGAFELRRITSHSGGTLLTPVSMDTADTLDANITVRTGSTVGGESPNLIWRSLFSTDDWGPGTLDAESNDHIFQTMFPIFSRKSSFGTKPIVLRTNEGLTVKFATNSSAGTFDIFLVFTQE